MNDVRRPVRCVSWWAFQPAASEFLRIPAPALEYTKHGAPRRGQSEPASACTVIFAHWCTIGVSVIFSKGLLVHHPVCR
jgi:hypothetical protein